MKVTVHSEQELVDLTKELIHVLVNLRYWTKEWNLHYGSFYNDKKKLWEQKADKLMEKISKIEAVRKYNVHIENKI